MMFLPRAIGGAAGQRKRPAEATGSSTDMVWTASRGASGESVSMLKLSMSPSAASPVRSGVEAIASPASVRGQSPASPITKDTVPAASPDPSTPVAEGKNSLDSSEVSPYSHLRCCENLRKSHLRTRSETWKLLTYGVRSPPRKARGTTSKNSTAGELPYGFGSECPPGQPKSDKEKDHTGASTGSIPAAHGIENKTHPARMTCSSSTKPQ